MIWNRKLVEVEMIHILVTITAGFAGVYGFQFKLYRKACALIRIARRMHPKEAEIEGL